MNNREMDVAMAELMGWRWDDVWGCLIPPEQQAKPDEMWSKWKIDDEGVLYREPIKENIVSHLSYRGDFSKVNLPKFSTDIAAAWLVVEKLLPEYDFYFEVSGNRIEDGWFAMFGDDLDKAEVAETAPLAICHAALKAVEE